MKIKRNGFALVSTLAILVMVAILVTAFVSMMRTERKASHNYAEYKRAQALAQGTLHRLLAENAAPVLTNGSPLLPYTLRTDGSGLPNEETRKNYLTNATPEPGIFNLEPLPGLSTANNLVRMSIAASGAAQPAYTPGEWRYLRMADSVFEPEDSSGSPRAPDWIDYKLPDGTVVGQIAFAIWKEGGKFDVNLAGADPVNNGLAPHDLGIEALVDNPQTLLDQLNGADGNRQRSNFSLRRISGDSAQDNRGDDHRIFSPEELIIKNIATADQAVHLGTYSRDFDVRPEWDGNRDQAEARKFLRSYVNNPDLYRLMSGEAAGTAGPALVSNTLDERTLANILTARGFSATESWMQIMRLLAVLRLSLPPHQNLAVPAAHVPLDLNTWTDHDIWGIALNIVQASDASSDQNLVAWNRSAHPNNFEDPNGRTGVRLSPYVTEAAIKLTRTGSNAFTATEYLEMWNPYPIDLRNRLYDIGETTGNRWPTAGGSLWSNTGVDGTAWRITNIPGPAAGGFSTITLGTKNIVLSGTNINIQGAGDGFRVRMSPFLVDAAYRGATGRDYQVSKAPSYSNSNASASDQFPYQLTMWIPANQMPAANGESVWYSFQIDDPRMGPFTRYSTNRVGTPTNWTSANDQLTAWPYTWQGYFNQHSLAGITDGPKVASSFGDGYNINFGQNWPASWPKNATGLNRALATFALPSRPFRNVGELSTVFAFRPWKTLGFAATTAPEFGTLTAPAETDKRPASLLDYLTTLGTITDSSTLNYKNTPGSNTGGFNEANIALREQDKRWLFESVDASGNPTGPIRPIRGKINLNSADRSTLAALLRAPYRMVDSLGLRNWSGFAGLNAAEWAPDLKVTIDPQDAEAIATAITDPSRGIRPLRTLGDLSRLDTAGVLAPLYAKYPESVVDAIVNRLAQFGTIRQQIYTVDVLARTLNPKARAQGRDVVTAEARLLARVYFDTFSRKAFIEYLEYR